MAEDFSVKGFVYLSVDDASVRRTAAEAADAVSRQAAEASGRDAPDPEPGERAERPQTSPVRIGGGIAELRRALKDQPGAGEAAPRRRDEGDAPRLQVADFGAVVAADVRRIAEAVGKLVEGRGSKVPRSEREASSEARRVEETGAKDRPKPPPVPASVVSRGEVGKLGEFLVRRGESGALAAARAAAVRAGVPPKLAAGVDLIGRQLKAGIVARFGATAATRAAVGAAAGSGGGAAASGGVAALGGLSMATLGPIGLAAIAAFLKVRHIARGSYVGDSMRAVQRSNDRLLAMPGAEASGAIQRIDLLREVGARRRAVETGRIVGPVAERNELAVQEVRDFFNPVLSYLQRISNWIMGLPVRTFAAILDSIRSAVIAIGEALDKLPWISGTAAALTAAFGASPSPAAPGLNIGA